jgi:hypothetical protein
VGAGLLANAVYTAARFGLTRTVPARASICSFNSCRIPSMNASSATTNSGPTINPTQVIDKRRFASLIVMPDKLDHPANHKHRQAAAQPDHGALLRQHVACPHG